MAIHKREVDNLMSTVEELERENLLMMGELFECNVEDLKISRSALFTADVCKHAILLCKHF